MIHLLNVLFFFLNLFSCFRPKGATIVMNWFYLCMYVRTKQHSTTNNKDSRNAHTLLKTAVLVLFIEPELH